MTVQIIGLDRFEQLAKGIFDSQKNLHELLMRDVRIYGQILERQAKEKHLSGPTTDHSLSVQTGRLRASIRALIEENGDNAEIRFGTDVPYAAIHEFGGTFGKGGTSVMPRRSFLQSSIDETYPDFETRVTNTLAYFADRGFGGQ
jgi:phage gpG-like protein